jgi:acyl carrier protein
MTTLTILYDTRKKFPAALGRRCPGTDPGRKETSLFDWMIGPRKFEEAVMDEIARVVHEFILSEFLPGEDPAELTNRTELITGGVLDSISTLKLVTFLEDHFQIAVHAHEAGVDHLDTIEQIAALVVAKKTAA